MGVRDELCGRTVGEFVLRERIGEGAYGAVYRCEQPLLGREAVIKVLHGKLRSRQVIIQRFLREARLASRLDHPYAAHVYAFGVEKDDGLLWIAMEMVHGTPLDRWLRERGPLSLSQLVPFFERIAEVVQTGHEHGIVHRDLKPSNVMVIERAGRLLPKLLDFGIAKLLSEDEPLEAAQLLLDRAPPPAEVDDDDGDDRPDPEPEPTRSPPKTGTLTATVEASDPGVPLASELTATGMAMGSPPYMAPELWVGEAVSPRADLYALGVLAYEAMTGQRPFHASSMADLAALHASHPAPPVGGDHPPALDRFFERALAKQPEDRPGTALELAAALRVASGLAEDPAELPRLERGIHDAWIADAPQPLAEAVAALEGARNAHQARDAARELFRALVRYLLVLALTSHAQVRRSRIDPVADALLRELGRRALDDGQRVRLMRQLVRALADERGAHPIPPLIGLLVPGEGEEDTLEPVLQLDPTTDPRGGGEDLVRSQVAQLVVALGRLLRAASFVLDYRLVVARSGMCESWMGLRRARRRIVTNVRGAPPPAGRPALLDRDGACALVLGPLAQVAPPTPGADDELFLFDGPDRRGARLVAAPHGFERHDPALWDWLGEHAFAGSAEDARRRPEARAPYLGLETFSAADADRFVGREREVDMLSNRLRTTALQVVVGASGAGKSSFVHAGVVPALPPGSRVITMRPGSRPLATLATRLGAAGGSLAGPRALIEALSEAAERSTAAALEAAALVAGAAGDGAAGDGMIVLVVDQLEELFTMCRDEAARERFAVILDALTSTADGRVRVIGTLRDDFMMRAAALPVLGPRMAASVFFLGNPSREDLIRTLVEPARRAGYELADPELAPQMADAVIGRPGALALLSFTASRLWELRDRQFHRLTRRAYEAMGGVGGALGQHAEATIEALGAEERRLVREAFRHLVTAEGTRAQLSVVELGQVLASAGSGAVIDKLVAARLLVIAEHEDGPRVEIVHEALLAAWPRVQQWIREDADSARMRDQVRSAARQWDERGRPRGLLWRDEALADLERWRSHHEERGLIAVERAFAEASRAAAIRGRRVRRWLVIAAFAGLAVALAVMLWLHGEATRQGRLADQRARQLQEQLVRYHVDRGQQALLGGTPGVALQALEAAHGLGADTHAVRFMLARARESRDAELATLEHAGPIWFSLFSADGTRVLTAGQDAVVRVWNAATGRELYALHDHVPAVRAAWSPAGEIVTADAAGTIRLWTREGRLRASIPGERSAPSWAVLTNDGARFAVANDDGTVAIGDTLTGELRARWKTDPPGEWIAFDQPGMRVVVSSKTGPVTIWSIEGDLLARLEGHTRPVWHVQFDSTGERVLTASHDRTARVWDARSGRPIHRLAGHEDRVTSLAVDERGRWIATASADTTVRIWSLDTGEPLTTLRGHTGQVSGVVVAPGDQLVSTSSDGTARVWDVSLGIQTAAYHHGGIVRSPHLDPGARRLVTTSISGTAKIWDLRRQSRLQTYTSSVASTGKDGTYFFRAAVAPGRIARFGTRGIAVWEPGASRQWTWSAPDLVDGTLVPGAGSAIAADARGFLHVVDASGKLRHRFQGPGPGLDHTHSQIAAYPDGRRAATCDSGGMISVWELATGRRLARREVGPVNELVLSADGGHLLAFKEEHQGGRAAGWLLSADLAHAVRLDHEAGLVNARFSPDGARLATLSNDGTVRIWSRDGALEAALHHAGAVWFAAWSSDGSWLATGTATGVLTIWDRAGWQLRRSIEANAGFISALAVDESGTLIATASADGTVKLWDVALLLQVARITAGEMVRNLAFEGDKLWISGPLATQAWRVDR